MNTKKSKHKKPNKPPNPNPPQNVTRNEPKCEKSEEVVENPPASVKIEEKVVIDTKCEVKEETLNVSDVKPVSELEKHEDSPMKPKRNKGKKKKQDEDFEIENPIDVPKEVIPVQEPIKENVTEIEEKDSLDEVVVPSARKKKNKKKNQYKPVEEIKIPEEADVTINEPIKEQKKPIKVTTVEVAEKLDAEIQELFAPKSDTPKDKKKKNKKKKRNDSEKSDKSEDVSCTTAFQQLLVQDEPPKEEDKAKVTDLIKNVKTEVKESIPEIKNTEELKETIVSELEDLETPKEAEETTFLKDEGKSKKKIKKDKKHQEPIQESLTMTLESPIVVEMPLKVLELQPVLEPIEKVLEAIEKEKVVEKEASPKPKAKIAKPVEKKRKGKHEVFESENDESTEIKVEDNKGFETMIKEPEIKLGETPIPEVIKSEIFDIPQETEKMQETDKMSIPADNKMGKKRKKSPKPKKKETNIKDLPELIEILSETDIKEAVETPTPIIHEIKESGNKRLSEILKSEIETIKEELPINLTETKKKIVEPKQEIKIEPEPLILEIKDDEGFETKTSKKKKKTKVPPPESAKFDEPKEDIQEKKVEPLLKGDESVNIPLNLSFSSEVEVRSVKTDESEGSTCEITPDVVFIRSASEFFDNNNNNATIQEVASEEGKHTDQTIPIIQGSGETPVPTPELISSGFGLPLFETKITADEKVEEKTDLKSKMLEVNQDMEELRLSIERSLAEFTALDKGEEISKGDDKSNIKLSDLLKEDCTKDIKTTGILSKIIKAESNISQTIEPTKEEVVEKIIPIETKESKEEKITESPEPPICPARKDHKGKGKSKKKGKQEVPQTTTTTTGTTVTQDKDNTKEEKEKTEKSEQKTESQEKGKQKSNVTDNETIDSSKDQKGISDTPADGMESTDFEPIEKFEDALTSSIDDVNKTFELIAQDADDEVQKKLAANKPEVYVTQPSEDSSSKDTKRDEKTHPVSQPKNLLGHYDIPVQSNRIDYKKEKNKTPNTKQAKVKIKDSTEIENKKESKESQTDLKRIKVEKSVKESFSKVKNDNDEYVYKYSFRKVFLQSACHICNKDLNQIRVPCSYCNLVFYCGVRHKDEDWSQHQALCFAVSTLAHMKDQKHIYADAQNCTGQDYRLLRMQMIVSAEKVLKRRLVPWEQEAMLYPRICADVACREWRQGKLKDCDGCAQLSYCSEHPEHLPKAHQRWCKSYSLYQKLVSYQQTKGRLEPKLPTKVMMGKYEIPTKMNEVLASMYEEKIDVMNDIQYAALTQLATAPLTTVYCLQLSRGKPATNGISKKQTFTIHVVGAELQFEADALNKWEVFFLHLVPEVQELKVVLISKMLNPGNLPLDLLAKIKLCENCRQNKRRVVFIFEDDKSYFEYRTSEDFINPDIICAFNPSIQRSSIYNGKDPWPSSITSIIKLKTPFIITSYTLTELRKDIARIKECTDNFKLVLEPGFNNFASVRPDRNFISDDEMPLLFKNYCVSVVLGC